MDFRPQLELAAAHRQDRRFAEAEKIYRQILSDHPDRHDIVYELGRTLREMGRTTEAIAAYRESIRLQPDFVPAYISLGIGLKTQRKFEEAIAAFRQATVLQPDNAIAHHNLANALRQQEETDAAIESYQRAISSDPKFVEAYRALGSILFFDRGDSAGAIAAYREAIRLRPTDSQTINDLGTILMKIDDFSGAMELFHQAITLSPQLAGAYCNLANALKDTGQLDEAIANYQTALRLQPDFMMAHSNLIYAMHHHPAFDAVMIRDEQRRWNDVHAKPIPKLKAPENDRDPNRRLRIGYVSPDFRNHVVGQNLLPLMMNHDHAAFEIFCYSDVARPDDFTRDFKTCADVWRPIGGCADSDVADLIRSDGIDILIDLALYLEGNRLLVFARKPAPVQLTYLGYCSSTGLAAMDYRFSDPQLDPPGTDLSVYSEKTIRLPETYWCYAPAGPAPQPGMPPSAKNGLITFGCLNNFGKVSASFDLWADILNAVPGSRLIMHSQPGPHLDGVRSRFAAKGISSDRLEFPSRCPWDQYIAAYNRIDIALDPFPWGGGITTCDAIYMGVPVVSLRGKTAVGRGGASILTNIAMQELIAETPRDYVRIAVQLASDPLRLAQLRKSLRPAMQSSPLMDAQQFAGNVEAAYRQIWHAWCCQ